MSNCPAPDGKAATQVLDTQRRLFTDKSNSAKVERSSFRSVHNETDDVIRTLLPAFFHAGMRLGDLLTGDVMRGLRLLIVGILSGLWPATALAQCNSELRYASRIAEAALSAQAEIKANALRNVADQLESQLGNRSSVNARLDARYSVTAAGGLALEAYTETVEGLLCAVQQRMADNPDQAARITQAQLEIALTLDGYFDPSLWQVDALPLRTSLRQELLNAAAQPPLFPLQDIDSRLPNPNFDSVRLYQILANIEIPQVVQGEVCAGIVQRSIRRVNPELLSSLGRIRPMLIKWLTGNRAGARVDLWLFASSHMSRQLAMAQTTETVPVTPQFLACVREARDAAVAEEATANAGTVTTTPAAGANPPPAGASPPTTTPPSGTTPTASTAISVGQR